MIADILEKNDILFDYENELRIPKKYAGGASDRIWHPDFHLNQLGILVEYAGMSGDTEYAEGVEKKKEVYEQMGVNVIWLYPEDLWEPTATDRYGKLREDASENILSKIDDAVGEKKRNVKPYSFAFDARPVDYSWSLAS